MKAAILYILISLLSASLIAQENRKEYTTPLPDTATILSEIQAGYALLHTHFDSSSAILSQALAESRMAKFNTGIATALVYMGMAHTAAGDDNGSLRYYIEAMPYAISCSGYKPDLLAKLYTGIGTPYVRLRDYNKAGYYYYKALQEIVDNKLQYSPVASHLYINLSNFWKLMNRYDYGMLYLKQGQRVAEFNKDTVSLIAVYASLAGSYYHSDEMKKAYAYVFMAEKMAEKKHFTGLQQVALINIGIFLRGEDKPLEAIPYYQKSIALGTDAHTYQHTLSSYFNLAFAYYEAGQYDAAKKYVLSTFRQAQKLNMDYVDLGGAMQVLSGIYQKEKKYDSANYWLNEYVAYVDSITQKQKDSSISKLEINYRLAEKNKVIALNQLQLYKDDIALKNKNIWIIGISCSVLLVVGFSLSFYVISKHRQQAQTEKIRNLEQGKELGNYKAMLDGEEKERTRLAMELHDGIGGMITAAKLNLGSVKRAHPEVAGIGELDEIIGLLATTANEIRQTAHNLMPHVLIKNGLKDALLLYCANINTGDGLNLDVQFHGQLDTISKSAQLIIYRITQELIQNMIKHAMATEAVLQIVQDNGRVNLIAEDNGTGFDFVAGNKGLGMQNLEYRVQALQGYLSVTSALGSGTSVYIEFDLEKLK